MLKMVTVRRVTFFEGCSGAIMEERLYQLEVKRTARMYELEMQKQVNIGNMTNALLKMANLIENMSR
jgi:hypothetical protein